MCTFLRLIVVELFVTLLAVKNPVQENVLKLFSINFQRQILKADRAKRSLAHREEIH